MKSLRGKVRNLRTSFITIQPSSSNFRSYANMTNPSQFKSCQTAMKNKQHRKGSILFSFFIFIIAILFLLQPINAQDTGSDGGSQDQSGSQDQTNSDATSSTTAADANASSTAATTSPTSSTASTTSTASSTTSSSASGSAATISDSPFNKIGFPCQTNQSLLLTASNQLMTDCGYLAWCNPSTNTCDSRGCRRDEWPFGYSTVERHLWPPVCNEHQFCPDEGSFCMDKIELGGACQLDRDDECQSSSNRSVRCLHNTCTAVNATLNNACIHENVVYTVYTPSNASYGQIISRDNCVSGLYCDSPTAICQQRKVLSVSCSADKECMSNYCQDQSYTAQVPDNNDYSGTCAQQPNITANKHQVWVYPVIIIVALAVLAILIVTLLKVHQRQGVQRRERARAYWESQRSINEKARLLKEDVRNSSLPGSHPGTPGFRVRSYGTAADAARLNKEESQRLLKADSIQEGPSRHASYDGAYAPSSGGHEQLPESHLSDNRHSKLLPSAPGDTYLDDADDSMMNTTIAGMHGHPSQEAGMSRFKRSSQQNVYSPLSDNDNHSEQSHASAMDSPRVSEAFLTPSHSQSRLSLVAAHDHSVLDSNIHSAARMYMSSDNHGRRTSAQLAGVRNRESASRYSQFGSPDATRTDLGHEWSFNENERK